MAYNNSGGSSGGGGMAVIVVIVLVGVGLFGGSLGSNNNSNNNNNSEYIETPEEDTIGSEEVAESKEDIENEEGFIKVDPDESSIVEEVIEEEVTQEIGNGSFDVVPDFDGQEYSIELNNNNAGFEESEIEFLRSVVGDAGYKFSDIDSLNRPSTAVAILTPDMYISEERPGITVNPTGWKNKRLKSGSWLFNRSHLIGYTFINDDIDIINNLITGTRDLNADRNWGMLNYEDIVREYVSPKGKNYAPENEILYEVKPIFEGDNLVAKGVQMRAQSLDDDSLNFNVFVHNVQDNVEINYADGTSVDHTVKK